MAHARSAQSQPVKPGLQLQMPTSREHAPLPAHSSPFRVGQPSTLASQTGSGADGRAAQLLAVAGGGGGGE